jgi:hypothetical protein
MDKDYIDQTIDNYKDLRRNLWTTAVVLTGGLASVIFSIKCFSFNFIAILKTGLFILGLLLDIAVISEIASSNKEILKLIQTKKGR